MPFNRYENQSQDNPLPVEEIDGMSYNPKEPISETNPLPVMVVEGQSYSPYSDVSETNPWPVVVIGGEEEPEYEGPLDIVPGAVVAYGQRALSSALRGQPLYTIREDAADAEQIFNSDAVTGAAPVAAITTFLDGASGFVATWNDQSGNDYDASKIAADQPAWAIVGANSKPGAGGSSGSGLGGALLRADPVSFPGGALTAFGCIYLAAADDTHLGYPWIFSKDDDWVGPAVSSASTDIEIGDDPDFTQWDQDTPANMVGLHVVEWIVDAGGDASLYIDGVLQDLTLSDGSALAAPAMVGGVFEVQWPRDGSNVGHSYYQEIIVHAAELSAPNRLAIRQNIAAYYGISLP